MKKIIFAAILSMNMAVLTAQVHKVLPPDIVYGELFKDVQLQHAFPDIKTFVDCIPKRKPADILKEYKEIKSNPPVGFSLKKFVEDNFDLPFSPQNNYTTNAKEDIQTHIKNLWAVLKRNPDKVVEGSSLLALPYPYIVPGGRFHEIYYWDSYFTLLGLEESGEVEMIQNMVNNFSYLINTYGFIPNGNRSYYITRSQPPFFAMMVTVLAGIKGKEVYATYQEALQKEYDYWTDKTPGTKHNVKMPDGSTLSRYYDRGNTARPESFSADYELVNGKFTPEESSRMYLDLRSAAESGWDFGSRWFADGKNIATIQTTHLIPVDLNGLLYQLELTLAKCYSQKGNKSMAQLYNQKAASRKKAVQKYCWNEERQWYFDYNFVTKQKSNQMVLSGATPLFFEIASQENAPKMAKTIRDNFLKPGGVVTSLINTHQQWDAPNGWAPLQWMVVKGLENYKQPTLAREIASRWIKLNKEVYNKSGKLMEKYNVIDVNLKAGGGEYDGQDGFGWTNGVLLKLMKLYDK